MELDPHNPLARYERAAVLASMDRLMEVRTQICQICMGDCSRTGRPQGWGRRDMGSRGGAVALLTSLGRLMQVDSTVQPGNKGH